MKEYKLERELNRRRSATGTGAFIIFVALVAGLLALNPDNSLVVFVYVLLAGAGGFVAGKKWEKER